MSGTTSYAVSARLDVTGNAQATFKALGRGLATLDQKIMGTERNLVRLAGLFPRFATIVASSSNTAASAMGGLCSQTQGVSTALSGANRALGNQTARLNALAASARTTTTAAGALEAAMRRLSQVPAPPRLPTPPRAGAGGSGGGGGQSLWRRLSGGPGEMAGAVATGRMPLGTAAGAYFGFRGLGEVIEEGGRLQSEMALAAAQGGVAQEPWRAHLRAIAEQTTNTVPGTTIASNVAAGMELRTAIPDWDQVLRFLPEMQRIAQVIATTSEGGSNRAEGAAGQIGRFLNLRGAATSQTDATQMDYDRLSRETELLSRNFIAFRNLDPRQWVGYVQQARVAGQAATESQLYSGFTASGIQAMGGQRFGTGQAAFVRQFANGVMTKQTLAELQRIGLVTKDARTARVTDREIDQMVASGQATQEEGDALKQGHAQRVARANLFRADLALADQAAWERLSRPQMARHGVDVNSPRALDAVAQGVGGTNTARGFLSWLFDEVGRRADIQAVRDVQPGAGQQLIGASYNAGLNSLSGGFRSLLQTLGESEGMVKLLNDMGQAFRDLGAWVKANPGFMEDVVRELRQFVVDVRGFAADLGGIVTTTASWIRLLKGEGLAAAAGSMIPPGARDAAGAVNQTVDGIRNGIDGAIGRIFRTAPSTTDVGPPNPDAAPIPPSWGGPMPRRQDGNIQLNSYQPMSAPGGSGTPMQVNLVSTLR